MKFDLLNLYLTPSMSMHSESEKAYYRGRLNRLEKEFALYENEYYEEMKTLCSNRDAWEEFFEILAKNGGDAADPQWENARDALEILQDKIKCLEEEYEEAVEGFYCDQANYLNIIYG